MKKLLLTLLFILTLPVAIFAQTVTDDQNVNYGNFKSSSKTCTVVESREVSGDIVIRSTVEYNGATYTVTSIDQYAFFGCKNLTSVIIPDEITSIGKTSFTQCSNLLSVKVSNNITSIAESVFEDCPNLSSVNIPENVTSIGKRSFYNCSSLSSISIPDKVRNIGEQAFAGCSGITSIKIPEGVKTIKNSAFFNCKSLTSVELPNSLTSIENSAFYECAFTSINIPSSVTSIGGHAFAGCSQLTAISIPDGVKEIGEQTFYRCSSLSSVEIPNSVTSIGGSAFYGCSGLQSINIPEGVTSIEERTFYACGGLKSITIPESVISIEKEAFLQCYNATELTIGSGVESIGENAFQRCTSLKSITYNGTNPSVIPENCFTDEVYQSATLNLPKVGVIEAQQSAVFESFKNVEASGKPIKKDGKILCTSIYFNPDVIEDKKYDDTFYLDPITIPYDIDRGTISWTSDNKAVVDEFGGPGGFLIVGYGSAVITATTTDGSDLSASCTIIVNRPDDFTYGGVKYTITDREQKTCKVDDNRLNNVLPKKIIIPEKAQHFDGVEYTVTAIEPYAFSGCNQITSVDIQAPINVISEHAFSSCRNMTEIKISDSVTSIGKNAFSDCTELHSVTIGSGVESIDGDAFAESNSIESITYNGETIPADIGTCFPSSVYESATLSLPNISVEMAQASDALNPFYNVEAAGEVIKILCKGLSISPSTEDFQFGKSVQFIPTFTPENTTVKTLKWQSSDDRIAPVHSHPEESDAIVVIRGLGDVTITATTTDGTDITAEYSFTVPKPLEFSYNSINYVVIDEESKTCAVANNANKGDIKNVIIPEKVPHYDNVEYTVVEISDDAFNFCPSLSSIEIPATVTMIGNKAFYKCISLTSFVVPDGVTSIGDGAFGGCRELTSVVVPDGVTSIGEGAYNSCQNLTDVTLGSGLREIGNYAFEGSPINTLIYTGSDPIPFSKRCFEEEVYETATFYGPNLTWGNIDDSGFNYFDDKRLKPSTIVMSAKERSAVPGESFTLKADVRPQNSIDLNVTWTSSDEEIATVDENGKVTAASVGEAVITATSASYSDISATCAVTVSNVFTVDGINYEIQDNNLKTCRVADNRENENLPAEIVIPATVSPFDGVEYTVTGIEADAFEDCSGITSVVISEGVTFVDQLAFWGCSSLASIEIPQSVKSIGEGAFGWCSSLTSVVIPDGVTSIGNQVLFRCSSLTSVVIPNSVTSIGDNAFDGCEKLTSIIIPDEVASIGKYTFGSNPNLESITYTGENAVEFPDNCFDQSTYESAKFTAPNLTSEKFEASSWKNFKNSAIKLSAITLSAETWSGYVGASVELSASLVPDNAIPTDIVWSTSNDKVATVDSEGKVTAVALGEAVITATAADGSGVKAECAIKVVPTPVSSIVLSETEVSLRVNGSVTLTATLPADATNKAITWSTSDEKVATVDTEGKVTAVALGEAVITATAADGSGVKAECAIKVVPTPVSSITLNETEVSLRVNGSVTLTAKVAPDDATNKTITWTTSNDKVATVDSEGKVTAVALGEAVITATAADGSGVKAECAIKVVPTPVSSIVLNETEVSLRVNGTVTLTATLPADATNKAITWSTSNDKVATVDENGKVTAVALGEAVITATAADGSGVKAECTIMVVPTPVSSIVLNETEVSLRVNGTVMLTVTVNTDATNKAVIWASSDEKVATVDQNGKVTAIAVGEAEITVTAADGSGAADVCYIEVVPPLAEAITLNVEEYSAKVGERFTLVATVTPEEAADQPLIWESSDPEIATVSSTGVVEVLAPGEVTITVSTTDGSNLSASCLVYLSSGIRAVFAETNNRADIYNVGGVLIRRDATLDDFKALPAGIYIVNHRKVLKK